MKRLKVLATIALAAGVASVAAACGGGGGQTAPSTAPSAPTGATETAPSTTGGGATKGGTYRVDWESSFNFTDAFDPTGEYLGNAWGIYSNLLIRTLMSYRHTAGSAGNEPLPDVADGMPQVSSDGKTYTFKLKHGVKFGPPVNRDVTSKDFLYAFERLANPTFGSSGYPNYYTAIEGWKEYADGKAKTIKGIETPDDYTIVFHLTQPLGDFLYRVAMPATGPIPEEVAKCFKKPGDYGRDVISSGPYMIEGEDKLDISSCDALKPISGYSPDKFMNLVRNPNYDPSTDSPELRESFPDRFEFTVNTNNDDIFNKVKAGQLDDEVAGETPKIIREYTTNESLKKYLKAYPDDSVFYVFLNLTQPPFDDVHVRKAVAWVMDRDGIRKAWGGPTSGDIAHHIIPPSILPGIKDYNPFPSPGDTGDAAKAMAEMKQSKYDTNKDGLCDAPQCKDVLLVAGTDARSKGEVPPVQASLAKIGITLKVRLTPNYYNVILDPKKEVPISPVPGWGKDYADPSTYFFYTLLGPQISSPVTYNESLVGLTREQAQKLGIPYPEGGVPSVDADYDACLPLTGDERTTCWENLDKKITSEIVPWVPYIWRNQTMVIGSAVTKWDFDQFSGAQAWAHVAVDPAKQGQPQS